jgi:hypothetical protein
MAGHQDAIRLQTRVRGGKTSDAWLWCRAPADEVVLQRSPGGAGAQMAAHPIAVCHCRKGVTAGLRCRGACGTGCPAAWATRLQCMHCGMLCICNCPAGSGFACSLTMLQLTKISQSGEQCAVQAGFEPRRRLDGGRQLLRVSRHDTRLNALDLRQPADAVISMQAAAVAIHCWASMFKCEPQM